jgi:hypothetical protein
MGEEVIGLDREMPRMLFGGANRHKYDRVRVTGLRSLVAGQLGEAVSSQ